MSDVPSAIDDALARLRDELERAARRRIRKRRGSRVAVVAVALAAVGVGAALAATGWIGRDFTPRDLERQYTVVTDDTWLECGERGCESRAGTHRQVQILPAMGVTFVLPSGFPVNIVPAAGGLGPLPTFLDEERARYGLPGVDRATGRSSRGTVAYGDDGGTWRVRLPDGTARAITWTRSTGSVLVTDRSPGGAVETTPLHAGDVVPLVPGSLDAAARTLEKAVTFDLPSGSRVHIFPTFNETYVGYLPLPARDPRSARPRQVLPRAEAARYGLKPVADFEATLPVTASGGEWVVDLGGGIERAISWDAGDDHVTVRDRRGDGATREQRVPVGHELPLVPFR